MGNYLISTCDGGHEQVAFTSCNCPMCQLQAEIADLYQDYEELKRRTECTE